jgi:release factor glutamine methyltransferase
MTEELSGLQAEVQFEPRQALDGGKDGLELIARLLPQAYRKLKPDGVLLLEVGAHQATAVENHLLGMQGWKDIQTFKDLGGWPRIVQATKGVLWTS